MTPTCYQLHNLSREYLHLSSRLQDSMNLLRQIFYFRWKRRVLEEDTANGQDSIK